MYSSFLHSSSSMHQLSTRGSKHNHQQLWSTYYKHPSYSTNHSSPSPNQSIYWVQQQHTQGMTILLKGLTAAILEYILKEMTPEKKYEEGDGQDDLVVDPSVATANDK